MRNVAPAPGAVCSSARPPCACVIAATIASPRPAPPLVRRARRVGAPEPFERVLGFFARHARALILDLDERVVVDHADAHVDGRVGRSVRAGVLEQVGDHLAQPVLVSGHDDRPGGRERHDPVRRDGAHVVDGRARQAGEVDLLPFQRTTLIEAGQQQEILDQHAHARRGLLDPDHGLREVVGTRVRAPAEQLRVAANRRERGTQLVTRVGHESAQACFRRGAFLERDLDLSEHRVEREAEPPDLRALVSGLDAAGKIAGRDGARGITHLLQRSQLESHEHPRRQRDREQDGGGDEQLDEQQVMQRLVDIGERERDHQDARTGSGRSGPHQHAVVRPTIRGVHAEVTGARDGGDGRQVGRRRAGASLLPDLQGAIHDAAVRVEELPERAVGQALQPEPAPITLDARRSEPDFVDDLPIHRLPRALESCSSTRWNKNVCCCR